ncbi:MAG: hypothetical protein Q4B42_07800, partial [Oscillospiraceae bacterium]|nr:hypothetical protein [Oscillospiraceae bacterium]
MKRPLAFFALCFSLSLLLLAGLGVRLMLFVFFGSLGLLGTIYWFFPFKARTATLCALCAVCIAAFCMWSAASLRLAQLQRVSGSKLECEIRVTQVDSSTWYTRPLISARLLSAGGRPVINMSVEFFSGDSLEAGDTLSAVLDFEEVAASLDDSAVE